MFELLLREYEINGYGIPVLASGVLILFLGLFTLIKNFKSQTNFSFFLSCFTISIWLLGITMVYFSKNEATAFFWGRFLWAGLVFIGSSIYLLTLSLIKCIDGRRKMLIINFTISSLFCASILTTNFFINGLWKFEWGYYPKANFLYFLFIPFFFGQMLVSLYNFYIAYKRSTNAIVKQQMRMVFIAFGVAYTASIDYLPNLGYEIYPFGYLPMLLFTGIIFYSIIRYKLWDISTVIHMTAMWAAMSSIVLIPLIGPLYFGYAWILSLSQIQLTLLIGAVTLLLIPYVRLIQPRIDHLFQRRKYDMQKILQELMQELAGLKNLDGLITKIASTIQEALYVSKITLIIWDDKSQNFKVVGNEEKLNLDDPCLSCIKEEDGVIEWDEIELNPKYEAVRHLARSYFQKFNAKVVLPLIHDGKLVGIINLGEKDNLKSFSKMDIDFLSNLRTEASIALSNSLLYDNVHKMSEELKQWSIELEHKVDERTRELAESKHQLEESYARLKELDRVKSDFFANVNHELRTPLTLILLPLEMILNKEFGALSPALEKNILTVKTNALRLLNLINGLLDLAKVDAGKMELYKSKNDLALIVQGVISSLSLMADQKKIRLSNVSRLSSPEIYFDREKIERVLINLISNALKFTNSGGSIQVSSEEKKGFAEIRIKDTGIGIPANFLEKIFERFTQVDGSSSRKHQGTGLGLALCKEFVEMHQGRIWAESDGEHGSVFILTLPLMTTLSETPGQIDRRVEEFEIKTKRRNEDLTKSLAINALYQAPSWFTADEEEEIPAPDPDTKYRILVVEDHREMREFIRSILKKEYSVVTAGDGVEGMDKTKSCLPDLIISDVMMPLKDGYQLCREIKTDQNTRHIPVILLTAKSDLPSKLQGLALCADDYLSKPFNTDELKARVKSLLQLKELEKENAQSRKMAAMAVMVAGVIHEINNPLSFTKTSWATISESVERLKLILASTELKNHQEEISELMNLAVPALEIVKKGIGRIEQVINRLRLFEGSRSLEFESLEIHRLMDHLIEMRAEGDIFPEVGGAVYYKDYQMTHPVEGISILLGQTFDVMIDNALKATGGTGPVWVKTWQEGGEKAFISIRDNGIGIKKETLKHLFEPFFTLRDVGEGMGLGLFLAYQVILAHHGSITVKSEEGAGTEMIIRLPFHQPKNPLLPQDQPVQFIP